MHTKNTAVTEMKVQSLINSHLNYCPSPHLYNFRSQLDSHKVIFFLLNIYLVKKFLCVGLVPIAPKTK
jgi:hypothetical protein